MSEADLPVSVIIPLFNGAATIQSVLAALGAQLDAPDYEVIVVDDGSTDGSERLVDPPARLYRQSNMGPSAARNAGAGMARGRTLLFLDADCIPPENWIAEMLGAMERADADAVMGGISPANDGIVPRLVQIEVEDRYDGMRAAEALVDFIAAPACGFRRSVFEEIGGFRADLRWAEDVEIAYRLSERGFSIAFSDRAPVAHRHQERLSDFLRAKYARALGRLRVFRLYPKKMRHDSWTPPAFKIQFVCVALIPLALLAAAFRPAFLLLAAALFLVAVGLGWPLVRVTANRLADLTGRGPAFAIAAGFILLRGFVILLALIRFTFERGRPGRGARTA